MHLISVVVLLAASMMTAEAFVYYYPYTYSYYPYYSKQIQKLNLIMFEIGYSFVYLNQAIIHIRIMAATTGESEVSLIWEKRINVLNAHM